MQIPILLQVFSASQALPIVAAAKVRARPLPVPYLRIALWCTILVLFDVMDLVISLFGSNHWTGYFTVPVEVGMTLWILSAWQENARWRRLYIAGIAATGAAVAAVLLLTNPVETFDVWVSPLVALFALMAVLHTLVRRALRSREGLLRTDWFWICLGIAVFWAVQVSTPAFWSAYLTSHEELVAEILMARSGIMAAGFVSMSWGMLCRRIPAP